MSLADDLSINIKDGKICVDVTVSGVRIRTTGDARVNPEVFKEIQIFAIQMILENIAEEEDYVVLKSRYALKMKAKLENKEEK